MNELATVERSNHNPLALMPVMDLEVALARRQAIVDFTKRIMVDGTDFGTIPGAGNKPTLLKPGAEKLTTFFGLSPRFVTEEKVMDWTGREHDGEPFFHIQYRCQLFRGDMLVGEGLGSCNSWERKYRFRSGGRVCPECGAEAIKRSRFAPRNNPSAKPGWYCFDKAGGCGANFAYDDPAILDQNTGRVPNDNPQDLVNTIDKMSQKRALVAATLIAVNASEFFTQDIEDMDFGAAPAQVTRKVDEQTGEILEGSFTEAPANGNAQAGPPADPAAKARAAAVYSVKTFVPELATLLGVTEAEVKAAAKMLGMGKVSGKPEEREKQFDTLVEFHALTVKDRIPEQLAIGIINGVVTREEAEAAIAAQKELFPEEEE